ncbi:MAG: hypothetical protein MHM6MM_001116 [Cercozoa sp. M6MM]
MDFLLDSEASRKLLAELRSDARRINWTTLGKNVGILLFCLLVHRVAFVVVLAVAVIRHFEAIRRHPWTRVALFLAVAALYSFLISGGMYSIIRKSPALHRDRYGRTSWLAPSARDQTSTEARALSMLVAALVTSLLALFSSRRGGLLASLGVPAVVPLASVLILSAQLVMTYTRKQQLYHYGLLW